MRFKNISNKFATISMDTSKRIKFIISNLSKVEVLADIGTDHGYVPLVALREGVCKKVIATDINKEPLSKAKLNAILESMEENIDFRLGGGFEPLEIREANAVVIAGMGGNLIKDILEDGKEKVKYCDELILVPAQNPEVLREYLYNNDYEIIKEDICFDEGIFYELFKVKKAENHSTKIDDIYYEVSIKLLEEKPEIMKEYIDYKIEGYEKILNFITNESESALKRKDEVIKRLEDLKRIKQYI